MSAALAMGRPCACSSRAAASRPAASALQHGAPALAPRRPSRAARCQPACALGSYGGLDAVSMVSQALTTGAVVYGAWLLLNQNGPLPEQDRYENSQQEPCPTCGGSGYESCVCTRWSDGDVGCGSCSKTGYMRCRSCGGGGKAMPYLIKVKRTPPPQT